jgi:hypothetical protein
VRVLKQQHQTVLNPTHGLAANPNGIAPQSPGLRGTSYPGNTATRTSTPTGLRRVFGVEATFQPARSSDASQRRAPDSSPSLPDAGGRRGGIYKDFMPTLEFNRREIDALLLEFPSLQLSPHSCLAGREGQSLASLSHRGMSFTPSCMSSLRDASLKSLLMPLKTCKTRSYLCA